MNGNGTAEGQLNGMDALLQQLNSSNEMTVLPVEKCILSLGENYTEVLAANGLLNNLTCLQHAPTLTSSAVIKGYVLAVMTVCSIIGNSATIYSIRKSRRRHTGHFYTLLFHLSIADLCVTFLCIMGDSIWYFTVEWLAGNLECKLFKFAQMTSLYISTFIMVLIGVDRFIAVRYPLKAISNGTCCRLVLCCWLLSGLLSSPQLLVFNVLSGPFQEPFYQCVTYGAYEHEWQEQLYTVFTIAFTFIIPLTILATTYLLTVCTLHRTQDILEHSRGFRTLIDPKRIALIRRAKMKSLRISVSIVITFVVCWTPYYVAMIYTFINRKDGQEMQNPDSLVFTAIFFFGVSNSLCNPIIYGYFHLWKPRRKHSERVNSSKKTMYTNFSLHDQRSMAIPNGAVIIVRCRNCPNGRVKSTLVVPEMQWTIDSLSEENTAV